MAINGNQTIVASEAAGFVSFYTFDAGLWTRTETFGTLVNVGEILGNTASAGAPNATTDVSSDRDAPLSTGAIVIYKRDPTSKKWRRNTRMQWQ